MGGAANASMLVAAAPALSPAQWAYLAFVVVLVAGAVLVFARGDWQGARGWERLVLFGAVFYVAPLAGFATEHYSINPQIAAMVPAWMPWHRAVAYFVGACFFAAALSFITHVQTRRAAALLALVFFLFVALMDLPGWAQDLHSRFAAALMLRELSFGAASLALAAYWTAPGRGQRAAAVVARYCIGAGVVFYAVEQFLHSHHVPGIPLKAVMPAGLFGHAVWTYLAAVVYAVGGVLLLAGKRTRAAAAAVGAMALLTVLVVYIPMAAAPHSGLIGFNYLADTLMYSGALLMLAMAMPRAGQAQTTRAPAIPASA